MTAPPPNDLPLKDFQTQEKAFESRRKCFIGAKLSQAGNPGQKLANPENCSKGELKSF